MTERYPSGRLKYPESPRRRGTKLSGQQVLDFSELIRAQLRLDKTLTIGELMRRTGAPLKLVQFQRRRFLEAGAAR